MWMIGEAVVAGVHSLRVATPRNNEEQGEDDDRHEHMAFAAGVPRERRRYHDDGEHDRREGCGRGAEEADRAHALDDADDDAHRCRQATPRRGLTCPGPDAEDSPDPGDPARAGAY